MSSQKDGGVTLSGILTDITQNRGMTSGNAEVDKFMLSQCNMVSLSTRPGFYLPRDELECLLLNLNGAQLVES